MGNVIWQSPISAHSFAHLSLFVFVLQTFAITLTPRSANSSASLARAATSVVATASNVLWNVTKRLQPPSIST